jgi:hypothetical protein
MEDASFLIKYKNPPHVLFKCWFTIHLWSNVKNWLGLQDVDPTNWHAMQNLNEWWNEAIHNQGPSKKAMVSLAMLVSWEIWKERNARVFRNQAITLTMLVSRFNKITYYPTWENRSPIILK